MRIKCNYTTSLKSSVVSLLLLGVAVQAEADWLDVEAVRMGIPYNPGTVKVGQTIKFWCQWHVNLAGNHEVWKASKTETFSVRLLVDNEHVASETVVIPAGATLTRGKLGLAGTVNGSWQAKHKGLSHQPHKAEISCDVNHQQTLSDHNLANNEKRIYLSVLPPYPSVQPGGWPTVPKKPVEHFSNAPVGTTQLVRPDLMVLSATAMPDTNCQNSQGARISVQVRNSGMGKLPASPGNYMLFVQAGAGLNSGGVELPVLARNQMIKKEVILHTPGSPAQLAGKSVPLEVQLNKLKWVEEANHNNNTRSLSVQFPATYCQPAQRVIPGQLKPQPPSRRLVR